MRVAIMQPAFLPWIGFFQRCSLADVVIFLDHVDADRSSKSGFVNRNRIKTAQGASWLTVPLQARTESSKERRIQFLRVSDDSKWRTKMLRTIGESYRKAPYFHKLESSIPSLVAEDASLLVDLIERPIDWWFQLFNITTRKHFSREMNISSTKSRLILDLCKAVGATEYISGPFGESYLDASEFSAAGITVLIHEYRALEYPQLYGAFEPNLAALDLVMNLGTESADWIRRGVSLRKLSSSDNSHTPASAF